MGFLSITDLMMGKMPDKPICLGKPPIDSAACRLCPFERECQETKLKILQCFGHCRPADCKGCPKLEECRARTQKNIVARATKKIPRRALESSLRAALSLLDSPPALMDSLSRMPVTVNGETFNCGDVLRGLVGGSINFEDGNVSNPTISDADLDVLFGKNRSKPAPKAKALWFDSYHCQSGAHCKACRERRTFREGIDRNYAVSDIDFWCPQKGAVDVDEDFDEPFDGDDWEENLVKAAETMRASSLDEVVCLNNTGMEDNFDVGITYVFEDHSDPVMLWVTDKLGKRREVLRERFQMPQRAETRSNKWAETPKTVPPDDDEDHGDIPF